MRQRKTLPERTGSQRAERVALCGRLGREALAGRSDERTTGSRADRGKDCRCPQVFWSVLDLEVRKEAGKVHRAGRIDGK